MLFDFHTHIFPDKIAEKTIQTLEKNILETEGVAAHACLSGTLLELKESMHRYHIDGCLILPIATTLTQSKTINDFAASISGKDHIYSFGSIHPMQKDWEQELERIKDLGLLGIKLHPEYQGVYIDSPEAIRVLKKAEKLGLVVVLHAGHDIGIRPPVHCMPQHLSHVLSEVDGSNIVAAHMGGWRAWDEVEEYLVGSNLNFDTSYCLRDMPKKQFLRIIEHHGADKIVFGTDSPWEVQGDTADFLRSLPLSQSDYDKIAFQNAKKLLNLPESY